MRHLPAPLHDDWSVSHVAPQGTATARAGIERALFANALRTIRRRWRLVALVSVILAAAWTATVAFLPKKYQATATVIVDSRQPETIRFERPLVPEQPIEIGTMASEVEIIGSRVVLLRTVQDLNLTANPEFNPHLQPGALKSMLSEVVDWSVRVVSGWGIPLPKDDVAPPSEASILEDTLDTIRDRLAVAPVGLSHVIRVTFTSQNPETASKVVNAIVHHYTLENVERSSRRTREAHEWISQRLTELRERSARSAAAVEKYRAEHGLIKGRDASIVQEQISQVSTELLRARTQRAEMEAAVEQMRASGLPELQLGDPTGAYQLLARLREQSSVISARYAEITRRYGTENAAADQARAQLADVNASIAKERDRLRQTTLSRLAVARATETTLSRTLADLKSRSEAADSDMAQLRALEREAATDQDMYANFMTRWRETGEEAKFRAGNVRILSEAAAPITPSFPKMSLFLPIGFVLSFGAASFTTLVLERIRPGVRSPDDLEQGTGLQSLGLLPYVPKGNKFLRQMFEESVSLVLARTLLPTGATKPRSLLVTSTLPGEGKTTTAVALARAAAEQGMRVLLVDADMRSQALTSMAFPEGVSHPNLADLLQGSCTSTNEAIVWHERWGVSVLPVEQLPNAAMRLFGSGAWEGLLNQLTAQFDLVIIDSPPVLVGGDSWHLARFAEITVLLTRWRSTAPDAVAYAVSQLQSARATLAGAVLTMVSAAEYGSYGLGDSLAYSHELMHYYNRRRPRLH
ncbi:Polysaccharide biosynthesis tyrosine autokinase [Rhodovastum atsumiense]|nr:polysaccharide biosynthesis tyrosine autokinase [Rhodovastum atsumiense]CAH2599849.1 Polysaccharide biosynthesis tyrosine autokinase [Rhodovastum atsumiense]